jgi:hypothetical protein
VPLPLRGEGAGRGVIDTGAESYFILPQLLLLLTYFAFAFLDIDDR